MTLHCDDLRDWRCDYGCGSTDSWIRVSTLERLNVRHGVVFDVERREGLAKRHQDALFDDVETVEDVSGVHGRHRAKTRDVKDAVRRCLRRSFPDCSGQRHLPALQNSAPLPALPHKAAGARVLAQDALYVAVLQAKELLGRHNRL